MGKHMWWGKVYFPLKGHGPYRPAPVQRLWEFREDLVFTAQHLNSASVLVRLCVCVNSVTFNSCSPRVSLLFFWQEPSEATWQMVAGPYLQRAVSQEAPQGWPCFSRVFLSSWGNRVQEAPEKNLKMRTRLRHTLDSLSGVFSEIASVSSAQMIVTTLTIVTASWFFSFPNKATPI